jgi:hypothetical protein
VGDEEWKKQKRMIIRHRSRAKRSERKEIK